MFAFIEAMSLCCLSSGFEVYAFHLFFFNHSRQQHFLQLVWDIFIFIFQKFLLFIKGHIYTTSYVYLKIILIVLAGSAQNMPTQIDQTILLLFHWLLDFYVYLKQREVAINNEQLCNNLRKIQAEISNNNHQKMYLKISFLCLTCNIRTFEWLSVFV